MINNDALSAKRCVHPQPPPPRRWPAATVHSGCPLKVCQSRGLSKLSFGRCLIFCICAYLSWKVLSANVLLIWVDLIWFDLQQNRMLLNQNVNSNVGLLVHSREAICSKSWISFLWNQDRKYQLGRIATVLVFEQINLEVEKVQIGFTEFAKSL